MPDQTKTTDEAEHGFIYHIRPRIFCPGIPALLINLHIDPLGIHLKAEEIRTGRPYPNKGYKVGCRRIGRKAVDGLLLHLPDRPPDIKVCAEWAIAAEYIAKHEITYKLLDHDFRAASDDMTLWYAAVIDDYWKTAEDPRRAWEEAVPKFADRFPAWVKNRPPTEVSPVMGPLDRTEDFSLPTIEPERILGSEYPRERIALPILEMAIKL